MKTSTINAYENNKKLMKSCIQRLFQNYAGKIPLPTPTHEKVVNGHLCKFYDVTELDAFIKQFRQYVNDKDVLVVSTRRIDDNETGTLYFYAKIQRYKVEDLYALQKKHDTEFPKPVKERVVFAKNGTERIERDYLFIELDAFLQNHKPRTRFDNANAVLFNQGKPVQREAA